MIFEDENDILEARRGNAYSVLCRSKKYVQFGFPKKPLAVTTAKQFEQYVKINRKRMNLRHGIRTRDDDWVFWDRRLA